MKIVELNLGIGMAKLFEKRFHNEEMAIKCLQENLKSDLHHIQENSRIDLARLYFRLSDHGKVIDLLRELYETNQLTFLNKEREFLGRLIFTFSLLAVGENKGAIFQIEILEHLSNILNSENAHKYVNILRIASESSLQIERLVNKLYHQ